MKTLALFLLLAGCADDGKPAGSVCDSANDCDADLGCFEIRDQNPGSCDVVGKVCSVGCADDTECAFLGSAFHCLAQCGGGPMFCAQLAP